MRDAGCGIREKGHPSIVIPSGAVIPSVSEGSLLAKPRFLAFARNDKGPRFFAALGMTPSKRA
jgi:hypothetical protein